MTNESKGTTPEPAGPAFRVPPRQQPYAQAHRLAFEALVARAPSDERLAALGAGREGRAIRLPVLDRHLRLDLDRRHVLVDAEAGSPADAGGGGTARLGWALLALHYLCAEDLTPNAREVSFSHFSDARGYIPVFASRIIGRFLATVGRTRQSFERAAEQLGATRLSGLGVGYRFRILPRVPIAIVRHDGDAELGPAATLVYQADAEQLLPAEDRIVAPELLLDRLSGKPMAEREGAA